MGPSTKTVISVGGDVLAFESTNGHEEGKTDTTFCPISGTNGLALRKITMTNHVHPAYWVHLTEEGFYFCSERGCPVVYFNNMTKSYFGRSDLRVAVMQKMEIRTEGRPMCYCTGVLEEQILYELLIKKCCDSLQDIKEYTGANKGKDCKITNPAGRCCGKWIKEVIDWAKNSQLGLPPTLLNEANTHSSAINESLNTDNG
ncbi:MAG: hypothetical protein ACFFE8_06120 [Candidatus Heimdallarchaeota archaeon]